MKKRFLGVLIAVFVVGMLAGCGTNADAGADGTVEANNSTVNLKDFDVDKYVELGEYKGLKVSVDAVNVDEADIDLNMEEFYGMMLSYLSGIEVSDAIKDRAVEVGDYVNIDYEGKKDDVAFEGGTAEGSFLGIGSNSFIDGFEDGLVGVMPGDTVDLNLRFPDGYRSTELAGADVVFTVKVNYILPEGYNDELIEAYGMADVTNAGELRQYISDYLYSEAQNQRESRLGNAVLEEFAKVYQVKDVPKELVNKYLTQIREGITADAQNYGVDEDTIAQSYYGCGYDELEEYVIESVREQLALQAVANRENLNMSDKELNDILMGYATDAGYDNVEDFIGDTSLEDYREYLVFNNVVEFLADNAEVTEN